MLYAHILYNMRREKKCRMKFSKLYLVTLLYCLFRWGCCETRLMSKNANRFQTAPKHHKCKYICKIVFLKRKLQASEILPCQRGTLRCDTTESLQEYKTLNADFIYASSLVKSYRYYIYTTVVCVPI